MNAEYKKMPPISFAMSFCEVFVTGNVALVAVNDGMVNALFLAVALGIGGSIGCMLGTFYHASRSKEGGK